MQGESRKRNIPFGKGFIWGGSHGWQNTATWLTQHESLAKESQCGSTEKLGPNFAALSCLKCKLKSVYRHLNELFFVLFQWPSGPAWVVIITYGCAVNCVVWYVCVSCSYQTCHPRRCWLLEQHHTQRQCNNSAKRMSMVRFVCLFESATAKIFTNTELTLVNIDMPFVPTQFGWHPSR